MKSLSVNYYFYILNRLEAMGLDRKDVSEIVPFDMQDQTNPGNRIDIQALHDLLKLSQKALDVPHIGINVSKSFRISNYGYAGSIFSTCETIAEAILCAEKYACLAHTIGKFRRDPNDDPDLKWVRYIWEPSFASTEDEKFRQITECILCNYALTIKWLAWSFDGQIQKITFRHQAKPTEFQYQDILGTDVEFEAPCNSLLIDRAFLEAPIPTANPLKLSLLTQKLNQLLAEYNQESDLTGRVEYAMKKVILRERPTLANVGAELSLTERALKRYMSKRNVQFRNILRDVKMELCKIYMKEGVSFSEIAQRLWYADQSAFTRAYIKWYGESPSKHHT